jgi:hypothetical protein
MCNRITPPSGAGISSISSLRIITGGPRWSGNRNVACTTFPLLREDCSDLHNVVYGTSILISFVTENGIPVPMKPKAACYEISTSEVLPPARLWVSFGAASHRNRVWSIGRSISQMDPKSETPVPNETETALRLICASSLTNNGTPVPTMNPNSTLVARPDLFADPIIRRGAVDSSVEMKMLRVSRV